MACLRTASLSLPVAALMRVRFGLSQLLLAVSDSIVEALEDGKKDDDE